jgi:hypothetical protein
MRIIAFLTEAPAMRQILAHPPIRPVVRPQALIGGRFLAFLGGAQHEIPVDYG